MKTTSLLFVAACALVTVLCVIQARINGATIAERLRKNQCYADVLADKDAQLRMLEYQIYNDYLNRTDSIASKEYIDFLEEKDDTVCDGNK